MRKTPLTKEEQDKQKEYYRKWHLTRTRELRAHNYTVLQRWVRVTDKDDLDMIIKIYRTYNEGQKQLFLDAIKSVVSTILDQTTTESDELAMTNDAAEDPHIRQLRLI